MTSQLCELHRKLYFKKKKKNPHSSFLSILIEISGANN